MIYDALALPTPLVLDADLCVVGSGAGGATAAMIAAEAGLSVVVLEAGELLTPEDMTQREEEMMPRLFWESGARTTSDRNIKILQGKGVGGSTLHNINLCKRIPRQLRERWHQHEGLRDLSPEAWDDLYDEIESLLSVSKIAEGRRNTHNRLLQSACEKLGWAGAGLQHNRTGCVGSGFCEVGCSYDAKNNALKICVPRLVEAGAEIISNCQAVRVQMRDDAVVGVKAVARQAGAGRPTGSVQVRCSRVCLSASATATPALLERSGVPDPSRRTGQQLRIHPAVVAAGIMDEPVRAWLGIPQTYECTELLQFSDPEGPRSWIVPAFAHPIGVATMLPGQGEAHRSWMSQYENTAVFTAMLHDDTRGVVRPDGDLGLSIDYWPHRADRHQLMLGLWATVHLLFAAGARQVMVPSWPPRIIERGQDYSDLREKDLESGRMGLTAVHPMASVPMSDDPTRAPVSSRGKHHHIRGLWVADGSLFPSSIGGPPQLSIYALGLRVGRALVAAG